MKYLFKVILLFLIVFNFIVPIVHYSCTVAVIIAFFYYLFFKKSLSFTYFFSRYCFIILAGTAIMLLINLFVMTVYGNISEGFYRRLMVQGWMLICVIFVLPILIEKEEAAFNESITVICGAFALQGLVHTLAFMVPSIGKFILDLQSADPERIAMAEAGLNYFRFYSLTGAPFFDLPSAYGVACIMFFRLQLIPNQNYLRGWKAFVIMAFIILGIILSGRTGFIGFSLGCLLYFVYKWNDFSQMWKNTIKISGGFLCTLVVFYILLTPQQRSKFMDSVFPYAFEAYYNWRDYGKFSTQSTDALMQVHYYPLDTKTIMWGNGWASSYDVGMGKTYVHTDAGYMSHIMFGGIFFLLAMISYQLLFFWQPMKMAKWEHSRNGDINFFCFFLLFVHMAILEYKGAAFGSIHIIEVMLLYIGVSYMAEQYALEDAVREEVSSKNQLSEPVLAGEKI
jgi:hypothetical protein